uniref:BARD1 Zinc finger RING-type domain-containing protein n=1 Tax=Mola mola TaxID=94237 RepID=A0A3Q3WGT5_MOLML
MKEPVCLGMCEHILCRSCAGLRAGDDCVVCHSPAWVKDIQINRQLSSIIELFSGLESLLHPIGETGSLEHIINKKFVLFCNLKNFKIWFSPRSRKVRCMVEKPSNVTIMESRPSTPLNANSAQLEDLSKNTASREMSEMMSKSRLEAINQHWGITEEVDSINEKEQPCAESAGRSSKRVSFLSPAVTSNEPQHEIRQESSYGPGGSTMGSSPSEDNTVLNDQTHSGQNMTKRVIQHDKLSTHDPSSNDSPSKHNKVSPIKHSSKRCKVDGKVTALETTPKRPKASPIGRRKSQMSPAVLNLPSPASPRSDKNIRNLRQERGERTPVRATISPKSPRARAASVGQSPSGSPIMKRNHKGETLLHVASIKGDVEAVKDLLDQGADPNLKDNAGWTPLHEACNLGHLAVVEVLVSGGALLNTPGYENDAPLHDAVKNGHPAIVKRLLQLGASQNHGGGNIMFWGCFCATDTERIHRIEGPMNEPCTFKILNENLLSSARTLKVGVSSRMTITQNILPGQQRSGSERRSSSFEFPSGSQET